MKKSLLSLGVLALSVFSHAQTTVFADNFEGTRTGLPITGTTAGTQGTFTTGSTPSTTYASTIVNTNGTNKDSTDIGALGGSNALIIGGNAANGSRVLNVTTGSLSTFSSPFNTTLASNTGLVTWTVNTKSSVTMTGNVARISPATGVQQVATILGTTNTDPTTILTSGDGYMVAYLGNSTTAGYAGYGLYRFTGGIGGTVTNVLGTSTFTSTTSANHFSVKVTYDPSTNNWSLFVRDDGATAFTDPTTGDYTQVGTSTQDATYTTTPMSLFGFAAVHNSYTGAARFGAFDNFRVTVGGASLPVKLGDITATRAAGKVVVNWKVYNEINVSRYIVERSADGAAYSAVGTVAANRSSSYSFTDFAPASGKNLCRLRSIDLDNSSNLSRTVLVDFSTIVATLNVAPNPVRNSTFTLSLSNLNAGKLAVRLYNMRGQLIMNQPINNNGAAISRVIELPGSVVKGNYKLVVTDGSNSQTTSLIVQ